MAAIEPMSELNPVAPQVLGDPQQPQAGKGIVLFDGSCPLCQRSVAMLKKLDWFHALQFQNARDVKNLPASHVELNPKKLLDEMHVLTPDRKRAPAGFRAFRWIAWRLPLLAAPHLCFTFPAFPGWEIASICGLRKTAFDWFRARMASVRFRSPSRLRACLPSPHDETAGPTCFSRRRNPSSFCRRPIAFALSTRRGRR
ncbi:MAG: DUF393 domain-containing protein [Gemmataceae bacterium]